MQDFKKVTIIGMGLIGGSIALTLKDINYGAQITGYDLCKETLVKATKEGAIDYGAQSLQEAVKEAELVILTLPVGYYKEVLMEIKPYLLKDVIITDVGSIKGYVEKIADQVLPNNIQFIGGHPMAGSEQSGFDIATATLFKDCHYFIVPHKNTTGKTIDRVGHFIKEIGAKPFLIDSIEHDKIVATISHTPRMVASLLVNLLNREDTLGHKKFASTGFRDTTRTASGDPEMWKYVLLHNREQMLESIKRLEEGINEIKSSLEEKSELKIFEFLDISKKTRDSIPNTLNGNNTSKPGTIVDKATETKLGEGVNSQC